MLDVRPPWADLEWGAYKPQTVHAGGGNFRQRGPLEIIEFHHQFTEAEMRTGIELYLAPDMCPYGGISELVGARDMTANELASHELSPETQLGLVRSLYLFVAVRMLPEKADARKDIRTNSWKKYNSERRQRQHLAPPSAPGGDVDDKPLGLIEPVKFQFDEWSRTAWLAEGFGDPGMHRPPWDYVLQAPNDLTEREIRAGGFMLQRDFLQSETAAFNFDMTCAVDRASGREATPEEANDLISATYAKLIDNLKVRPYLMAMVNKLLRDYKKNVGDQWELRQATWWATVKAAPIYAPILYSDPCMSMRSFAARVLII